jgi:hypothetical protein
MVIVNSMISRFAMMLTINFAMALISALSPSFFSAFYYLLLQRGIIKHSHDR